jgi:rhombotail lipoprotein
MDAVVYDVPARALLFNAQGSSSLSASATPVTNERVLRQRSEEGFDAATADLIANLEIALGKFQEQAATGTVRGPGTPAVVALGPDGAPTSFAAKDGSGALGAAEIAGIALLLLLVARARR